MLDLIAMIESLTQNCASLSELLLLVSLHAKILD